MKDKKVIIDNTKIVLEENHRSIVMEAASKKLTEMYAHIVCQNKGNVLDIGFGMGFSANKMSELADHYTCIEINPQIGSVALEWAKDKPNVDIIIGDWIDVIPKLERKFDGIFMDTHYDPNYSDFEAYASLVASKGCILSIWNYFTIKDQSELNLYEYDLTGAKYSHPVTTMHKINWTYFNGVKFTKGSNVIKSNQTSLL